MHTVYMKSSDAKASKCHLKFSSRMIIFIKLVHLSLVISLKWQWWRGWACDTLTSFKRPIL